MSEFKCKDGWRDLPGAPRVVISSRLDECHIVSATPSVHVSPPFLAIYTRKRQGGEVKSARDTSQPFVRFLLHRGILPRATSTLRFENFRRGNKKKCFGVINQSLNVSATQMSEH